MLNTELQRLIRRLLVLAVLVGCLAVVASTNLSSQTAYARGCCSECEAGLDNCLSQCSDSACQSACFADYNRCYRNVGGCDPTC